MINKFILSLLCVTLFGVATNAQAPMKLIAKVKAQGPTENILDSTIYFHSGTKGNNPPGKFNIPEFMLMEDSNRVYENDGTNVVPKARNVYYYTGNDLDSIITYEIENGAWEPSDRVFIQYASGKPDTVFYDTWSEWQGSKYWRGSARIIYTWNSNNWATRIRQTRSFGGGGGPNWRNREMWSAQYSSNMQTEIVMSKWDNSQWEDSFKKETNYTGGNISSYNEYEWDGNAWKDIERANYYYGSQGLDSVVTEILGTTWIKNDKYIYFYPSGSSDPDSMIYIQNTFGGSPPQYINQQKHVYTANADHQRLEDRVETWDGKNPGSFVYNSSDTTNRWYWGWNVGINDISSEESGASVVIYPSPANDVITIKTAGIEASEGLNYSIVNMNGTVVKSWIKENTRPTTVTVRELPTGYYVLKLDNGQDVISQRFVVIH